MRRSIAVAVMLLVVSLAAPVAQSQLQPDPRPLSTDPLLLVQWPSSARSERQMLVDRKVTLVNQAGATPLLDGAQQPHVARDGRHLFFAQYRTTSNALTGAVAALDASTMAPLWTTPFASQPLTAAASQPFTSSVTSTSTRVFAASLANHAREAVVTAINREDGATLAQWRVDLGRASTAANVFADADGAHISIMALGLGVFTETSAPPLTVIRLDAETGAEQARYPLPDRSDAGGFAWSGTPIPDTPWLFKLGYEMTGASTSVGFLDLASGATERLEVTFSLPPGQQFMPHESGTSPDGRTLYLFSPLSRELAVINLPTRTLVQKASLSEAPAGRAAGPTALANLTDWLLSTADAKVPFSERLQIASDGRIFGVAVVGERNNVRADGIWEIDLRQWSIARHLLPGSQPWSIVLSEDGARLYALDTSNGSLLHTIDLVNPDGLAPPQRLPSGQIFSIVDLYRDRWGQAPPGRTRAEVRPRPVPGMNAAVAPATALAGDPLQIEVRLSSPFTGQALLQSEAESLQFAAPARVTARLLSTSADETVLLSAALEEATFGVYRGSLAAPAPSAWSHGRFSVEIVADWPDGSQRRTLLGDAVTVQPAFGGSDGRRYVLRSNSEPRPARANEAARVTLAFVDAETGAGLPESTSLASAVPDHMDVTFYAGSNGGVAVRRLAQVARGVYAGEVSLFSPGEWQVLVAMSPGTPIPAGALTVTATAP